MSRARQRAERHGRLAETIAMAVLLLKGYRVVARRYRTPVGELDLVARRGTTLAIVEVKLRQTLTAAIESIAPVQQQRIARAAAWFVANHADCRGCDTRFDVVVLAPWRWPRHLVDGWHLPAPR